MMITIHSKGLHLSDEERVYIEQKMEKVSHLAKRLQDDASEIHVDVSHDQTKSVEDEITCVITVTVPRSTLHAEASGEKVTKAVDLAKQKLLPQIEKYKEKFQ